MLQVAVIGVGFVAQLLAWRAVASGRFSALTLLGPVQAFLGIAALLARHQVLSGRIPIPTATVAGLGSGVAFYLGTLGFVTFASGWEGFRTQVEAQYRRANDLPLVAALALAVLVAAPGEELFWRGLAQPRLHDALPGLVGPGLAWLGYVASNAASASVVFVVGAIAGGVVWGALALWTMGILASILCHTVWTGMMLVRPPASARGMMRA